VNAVVVRNCGRWPPSRPIVKRITPFGLPAAPQARRDGLRSSWISTANRPQRESRIRKSCVRPRTAPSRKKDRKNDFGGFGNEGACRASPSAISPVSRRVSREPHRPPRRRAPLPWVGPGGSQGRRHCCSPTEGGRFSPGMLEPVPRLERIRTISMVSWGSSQPGLRKNETPCQPSINGARVADTKKENLPSDSPGKLSAEVASRRGECGEPSLHQQQTYPRLDRRRLGAAVTPRPRSVT